jgi:hypothetical protein
LSGRRHAARSHDHRQKSGTHHRFFHSRHPMACTALMVRNNDQHALHTIYAAG